MSEIRSEESEMSSVAEAAELLRRVAGPEEGRKTKGLIRDAAKLAMFSYTRTKDIWYGDARRIDAKEMDRLRDVAAKRDVEINISRLLAMREGLAKTDPEFHRETIDALEFALRAMGREVVPMALRQDRRLNQNNGQPVKQHHRT